MWGRSGITRIAPFAMARSSPFQPLIEADGRAGKIEFGAQLVFEEALIAKMQRLQLIGEKDEGGRRRGGLRYVENLHFAAGWGGPAIQVHFL